MQASIYLASSSSSLVLPLVSCIKSSTSNKRSSSISLFPGGKQQQRGISIKAAATSDAPEVDYSSMDSSVFPAEACETLGGVACDVEMFPETKLKKTPSNSNSNPKGVAAAAVVDREYLQYDHNPKTVFIAEACDDLGGEFCEPAFQTGPN